MSSQTGPLTIDTHKLRLVLNAVLDHVEEECGRFLEVDRDHYWQLELGAMFAQDLHEPGTASDTSESVRSPTMCSR